MKYFNGEARLYSDKTGISQYRIMRNYRGEALIILSGTYTIEELEQLTTAAKQGNLDFELPRTIKNEK